VLRRLPVVQQLRCRRRRAVRRHIGHDAAVQLLPITAIKKQRLSIYSEAEATAVAIAAVAAAAQEQQHQAAVALAGAAAALAGLQQQQQHQYQ
jgi:hypothetical protein